MVQKKNGLTPLQIETLEWIKSGQPPEAIAGDKDLRHRIHSRKLERLGLVEISGSGETWEVKLTELGEKWPEIPLGARPAAPKTRRKPRRPASYAQGKGSQRVADTSRPATPPPAPAESTKQLFEEILASEFNIVSRRLSADSKSDEWKQQVAALSRAKSLLGEEWRVSSQTRREGPYYDARDYLDIGLFPVDRWLSEPLPDEVKRYHPAVGRVMKYSTGVSPDLKPRAKRLLHALFREADVRGWKHQEIEIGPNSGHKTSRERGSLKTHDTGYGFTDGVRTYFVSASEQVDVVERAPTKKELAEHQQQLRWYPQAKIKKFYDHPYNGRLTVTIGSRQAKDTKTKTAEKALPGIFSAISLESAWADYRAEMDRRAKARWNKKVAIAEKRADVIFRNRALYDSLEGRALEWEKFRKVQQYVADLKRHVETLSEDGRHNAAAWLAWCEQHLDDRNPLRNVCTPQVRVAYGYERDNLVSQIAQRISDAEIGE
ncbi:hypothetical protein [Corynebacterium sp.]|uniref:hypothetical protein n=1 Tax=Corynebacterium sp. TaxID=1720 RepID=UPI0026E10708|nr:hypothetical protein [Corynebacterium sp.]MDO5511375.1 hypothetical protein [Corynebacterium sp.]